MMDHKMEKSPAINSKDMVEWGVKQAKLAVAVAIIKSKPPGISGRQHAEHLASKLRSQDENWKKKFHQLQGEVLRLRQELLLSRMHAKPNNDSETVTCVGDGVCELPSQDLAGSATDPLTSNMDSGCGTDHTETTTDAERPASPLATCARLPTSGLCEAGLHGKAALLHMQFLQSLLGLSRADWDAVGTPAGELGPDGDGDGSVMADSVSQLLTCLAAAASGDVRPLTPQSLLGQASRVAARAVDAWLSHREPPPRFAAHVEGVLDELVGMLLCNDQLNRFRVQERLTECLVLLGGSCYLRSLLISHGLSEINRMAEHLWITCQAFGAASSGQPEAIGAYRWYKPTLEPRSGGPAAQPGAQTPPAVRRLPSVCPLHVEDQASPHAYLRHQRHRHLREDTPGASSAL
ncbi:meiosis-specific protein MEI4 isoform X2 [Esox lucius]|uniref:meiosis-specific protein MEI4 isoform X2 n=1 Tax=Esox lucius TaxID=8010 RepID=UPI0014769816|nr:meiosis-specific protein MEI4 isoform X2 [Esox lucius]